MASNQRSMQFEPWNLILIKHGCEEQIEKKGDDEILSKKKTNLFRHFSNICCPLTSCRE